MNLFPRPSPGRGHNACTLLPVDAAYAFDYLAILYVKREAGLAVASEIERVEMFLRVQHANMGRVLASGAFKQLLSVNQAVFDAIEKAHGNKISARAVQAVNAKRFAAKRRLQEAFWPLAALAEVKTALGVRRGARRLTNQPYGEHRAQERL